VLLLDVFSPLPSLVVAHKFVDDNLQTDLEQELVFLNFLEHG
jgi:hypothetical protein